MAKQLSLFFNESSESMDDIEDNSIQTVITSPPYYDMKDYGHEDQIGVADASYEDYHSRLSLVWNECHSKLRDNGTMWVVVDTLMDDGDLRLLPQDIVERVENAGFDHQETIVWYKPTSLAGMNPKLLANKKEYILLFSKDTNPKFDASITSGDSEKDPAVGQFPQLGNMWRFPVKRGSLGKNILHKAPFPLGLVERMVRCSTDPGDPVLDPFLGSGTTACASINLGRDIFGYEINNEFKSITIDRISKECGYDPESITLPD